MSLESILSHISDEASAQKEKIIQEAQKKAQAIIQEAQKEADILYQEILDKEKALYERQKHKLIVQARLRVKNNLLSAKQELIDGVFEKLKPHLKKEQLKRQLVFSDKVKEIAEDIDFYLNKLRLQYETEIAKILF